PTFSTPNMSGTPTGSVTPSSAGTHAQSPFGSMYPTAVINGVVPQNKPVKTTKKLTLGDYMKKKDKDTSAAVLKTSLSEESKTSGRDTLMTDAPPVEKADPAPSASSTTDPAPSEKSEPAASQPNGTL